jgi:hypothetical protein
MSDIQSKLDGDVPDDVAHWIVEYHHEINDRDMTPLLAVRDALKGLTNGHCWTVTHVRSGLQWSVNLARSEVVEIVHDRRQAEGATD